MKRLTLLLLGAMGLAGCQNLLVSNKEGLLQDAGFEATPADTQEGRALMAHLPARQIMAGTDGTYVYADPVVCHCVYVGSPDAYVKYLRRTHFVGGSNGPGASMNMSNNTAFYDQQALH